jgi:hypothetical protein
MIKGLRPRPTAQYFARKPPQTLEKLLQKMDEYIRADNNFRQRREEAYRFSKMTRGFGGRIHLRHVRSIHNSTQSDGRGSQQQRPQYSSQASGQQQSSFRPPAPRGRGAKGFGGRYGDQPRKIYCLFCGEDKGHNTRTCQIKQRLQYSSQASGQQQSSFRPPAQRGRGARGFEGRYGDQPRKIYCLFCGEDKGHNTRTCQITIQKQKEIAKAEARQSQLKQVLHTASCHSPYIPEYVCNHPAASVASASQLQVSWPQLPPPSPLQPAYSRVQQLEGSQQSHQQRDFREGSEARIVNSTVPESKHIY